MGPVNAADLEVVQKLNSPSSVDVPWARVSDLDRNVLIYDINHSNYRVFITELKRTRLCFDASAANQLDFD